MSTDTSIQKHFSCHLLAAYVAGECTATEKEEVQAHFARCPECRAHLDILRRILEADENQEVKRQLELLLPLGLRAAEEARRKATESVSPTR